MIRDRLISISNNLYIIIFNLISLYRYYISLIDIISSNKKGKQMDIVGEIKIIRITNKKNGLFKELDFNKYTKDDILKMIEFYNYRLLNYSLNIYDKFTIKREAIND